MKLCKNCKYISPNPFNLDWVPFCEHEFSIYNISKVDGRKSGHSCQTMRGSDSSCGPEGKLFEPDFFYSIAMMFQRKTD